MGTIMAVVAVLLIHMDRKAVTSMKPSISLGTDGQTHWCSSNWDWIPRMPPAPGSTLLMCGNSQSGPHPDDEEHLEGDAFVQVPMLNSNGHHQPTDEQDIGVLKVHEADLAGRDS